MTRKNWGYVVIKLEKIVKIEGLKLPEIAWVEPNKDHPFEGYAVFCDGEHAATATISALEWKRGVDRERIEKELRAYVLKYPEKSKKHLVELMEVARAK